MPVLDEFGLLRLGGQWVALSPLQETLFRPLVERFGLPVARDTLAARAWPDGEPLGSLDLHILRLRARIAPLGLVLITIRGRGFVLTTSPT